MANLRSTSQSSLPLVLVTVFALSGFSGLIYESKWTHYLKLFLGHAAYTQTLILALCMVGADGGYGAGQLLVVAVEQSPARLCRHGRGDRRLCTGLPSGV